MGRTAVTIHERSRATTTLDRYRGESARQIRGRRRSRSSTRRDPVRALARWHDVPAARTAGHCPGGDHGVATIPLLAPSTFSDETSSGATSAYDDARFW